MARAIINIGSRLRLRERIFPGHPLMRMDAHSACMVDLPAGSLGVVTATHGSDIQVKITGSAKSAPASGATEIWIPSHLVDVLLQSA